MKYRVEHVDTDASGVVHFSRYASLAESGVLEELANRNISLQAFEARGLGLRMRQLKIRYFISARFGDELEIAAKVLHIGVARMVVEASIQHCGTQPAALLATCNQEFAVVDATTQKPVPIPQELIDAASCRRHN